MRLSRFFPRGILGKGNSPDGRPPLVPVQSVSPVRSEKVDLMYH